MLKVAAGTVGLWLLGALVLRATVIQAEVCPAITAADARGAAVEAGRWIQASQAADGTYRYELDRSTGRVSPDYNVVRHAGVTMSLYQLVAAGEEDFLPAADRGLGYMQRNLLRGEGWAAFRDPRSGRVALGASSLLLVGLAQRRIATGDPAHDGLMHEVAGFVIRMQQGDGSFLAEWDEGAGAPVPGFTSRYATGEAFWALALMHRLFPGEGWDEPSAAVARYLAEERDAAEGFDFPPWADQWAAYGLAEMSAWEESPSHQAYARSLAERFGFLVRVESRRRDTRFSELLQGRQARAAGLGTWVEGLGALWQRAERDPVLAPLRGDIAIRGRCAAGMLVARQVRSSDETLAGAWFTGDVTRMDDQQHALSGLLLVEAILQGEP